MKTAIVTGGSRGIGAATAKLLAKRGFAVEILYHSQTAAAEKVVAEIQESGGTAKAMQCDVSQETAVNSYINQLEAAGRDVAVLVNNAGIAKDNLLMLTAIDAWHRVLETNLTGTFLMTKAVAPLMMDRGGGAIINVSSNSAHSPGAGQVAYAASKGGVEAFTRAAAVELRRLNIRVNCVRPGRVRTEMTEKVAEKMNQMDASRWGEPIQIAEVIAFLASQAASYLTGQVITADGGLSISRPQVNP